MDYFCFHITLPDPARREELIAFLTDSPFDTFIETEPGLEAYVPASEADAAAAALDELAGRFHLRYERTFIAHQNWNAQWEASFQPVQVDDFVAVRASFHPPLPGVEHDLVIDPRMAFGTGHHATTYLMMALMRELDLPGRRVLDYGCGTGVLAILAARLGAADVLAVDIEEEAFRNTLDNADINGVRLEVYYGTLEAVPFLSPYDIILANINRNVILDSLPALYEQLRPDGDLLVSGILGQDREKVREAAHRQGFSTIREVTREGWMAWRFRR